MNDRFDANTLIAVLCVFAALMGIFCYCERKTRKRNHYKRLPPPSPLCSRGFDYK